MYSQFPPWGFNPWVQYPLGPAGYFQPEWVPAGPMYRRPLHDKRPRFNQEARPRDAITVRGNQPPVDGAHERIYKGGRQSIWVPVKHAERKVVKHSDDSEVFHGSKIADSRSIGVVEKIPGEGDAGELKDSSIKKKDVNIEIHRDNTTTVLSGMNQNIGLANMHSNSIMKDSSSLTFTAQSPIVFGSFGSYGNPSTNGSQIAAGNKPNQQNSISANSRIFFPGTTMRQYRPKNLGAVGVNQLLQEPNQHLVGVQRD